MSFHADAARALTDLMTGMNNNPENKASFNYAVAELKAFLDKHQYFGEAAIMVASLQLAQEPDLPFPDSLG